MALTPTESQQLATLLSKVTNIEGVNTDLLTLIRSAGQGGAVDIAAHNNNAEAHAALFGTKARRLATGNINYYLARDGSDVNDGLTANRAFLTWNRLLQALRSIDGAGYAGTVTIGAGVWTGNFTLTNSDMVGFRSLIIQGAGSGTDGTIIDSSSEANKIGFQILRNSGVGISISGFRVIGGIHAINLVDVPQQVAISDMYMDNLSSNMILSVRSNLTLTGEKIAFGTCDAYHISHQYGGGTLLQAGNYKIFGGAGRHLLCGPNAYASFSGNLTIENEPNFTDLFYRVTGKAGLSVSGLTINGSARGKKFSINEEAYIYTNGRGENWIPGDVAGTMSANQGCWIF